MGAIDRVTEKNQRFVPRSPRYELRPEDKNQFQFTGNALESETQAAYFQNLSRTGMKFVSDKPVKARVGDLLIMEFPVPRTQKSVIGRARVVRMDSPRHVAVEFLNLKDAQMADLEIGLDLAFKSVRFEKWHRARRAVAAWLAENKWKLLLIFAALALTGAGFYWLLQPNGNYGPDKTVVWGTRFGAPSLQTPSRPIFYEPSTEELRKLETKSKSR